MHAILLTAAIAATPVGVFSTPNEAAAALAEEVRTGTLLLTEGDCLAVKAFTVSPYTHVAAVVVEGEKIFIYDSQNGIGVRKLPFEEYLAVTKPDELHILQPKKPLDAERAEAFRTHLEKEIGRPYAISHHLTGKRCDGLHCAEYVTDALIAARIINAQRPPRVSPASLRKGLLRHKLYVDARTVVIMEGEPETESGRSWCHRLWLETKDCCATCWSGFNRAVLCR